MGESQCACVLVNPGCALAHLSVCTFTCVSVCMFMTMFALTKCMIESDLQCVSRCVDTEQAMTSDSVRSPSQSWRRMVRDTACSCITKHVVKDHHQVLFFIFVGAFQAVGTTKLTSYHKFLV